MNLLQKKKKLSGFYSVVCFFLLLFFSVFVYAGEVTVQVNPTGALIVQEGNELEIRIDIIKPGGAVNCTVGVGTIITNKINGFSSQDLVIRNFGPFTDTALGKTGTLVLYATENDGVDPDESVRSTVTPVISGHLPNGNPCVFSPNTPQEFHFDISIIDTEPEAITVSVSAAGSSAKANQIVNINYLIEGDTAACSAIHPVVEKGTTANSNQYSIDTSINLLQYPNVPLKILKQDLEKLTEVFLSAKGVGCNLKTSNAVIVHIPKKEVKKPITVSALTAVSLVKVNDTVNVNYKIEGDTAACSAIHPVVTTGTTANSNQYSIDTSINLLQQPGVPLKILKQDLAEQTAVVLGARGVGCTLKNSNTVAIRILKKEVEISYLSASLKVLKTEVKKGTGNNKIASIKFSLPSAQNADGNCVASAWVTVIGGTAKQGKDFNFPSSFRVNFGHADGNTKVEEININVLAGIAGSGDKTVVLRAEFNSMGGATGNSCPLTDAHSEKMMLILKDTAPAPKVSISTTRTVAKTGDTFEVRYVIKDKPASCNVAHPVVAKGTTATADQYHLDNRVNILNLSTVPVKILKQSDKPTKLVIGIKGCGFPTTKTVSIIIPKKANQTTSKVSILTTKTVVKTGETFEVRYVIKDKPTSCDVAHPVVVKETTATADQYQLDTRVNILNLSTVPVKILKQSDKSAKLVIGIEGCNFSASENLVITIPRKTDSTNPSVSSASKKEPENIRTLTCDALGKKTILTPTQKSYFKAQCGGGKKVTEEEKRNFEPEEISVQATAVLGAAGRQLQNVRSRLSTLRATRGARGVDVSGATLNVQGSTVSVGLLGGAAGDDENGLLENSRWGFFANGDYSFGDENRGDDAVASGGDRNFDFNSAGLTFGADYRFSGDKKYAGIALGYKDFSSDFTSQKGGTDVKGYNLSVYGTYLLSDKAYLDATIGYGKDKIDSSRPVNNDGTGPKTTFAIGKSDAKEFTFSVGGGYEFYKGEWSLTPYGRMDYTRGTIDAYKETGHESARSGLFSFDKQDIKALTSTMGIKVNRVLSTSNGVFVPYALLEWKHEFKGKGAISGTTIDPLTGRAISLAEGNRSKFDRNYYNIGVGVSAQLPKGKSAFLSLESRQGDSVVKDNAVRAGFRWEF
jgi:outer membrane autotransporter protein